MNNTENYLFRIATANWNTHGINENGNVFSKDIHPAHRDKYPLENSVQRIARTASNWFNKICGRTEDKSTAKQDLTMTRVSVSRVIASYAKELRSGTIEKQKTGRTLVEKAIENFNKLVEKTEPLMVEEGLMQLNIEDYSIPYFTHSKHQSHTNNNDDDDHVGDLGYAEETEESVNNDNDNHVGDLGHAEETEETEKSVHKQRQRRKARFALRDLGPEIKGKRSRERKNYKEPNLRRRIESRHLCTFSKNCVTCHSN